MFIHYIIDHKIYNSELVSLCSIMTSSAVKLLHIKHINVHLE